MVRLAEDEADAGGEKKKKTLPWFNYHVPTRSTLASRMDSSKRQGIVFQLYRYRYHHVFWGRYT